MKNLKKPQKSQKSQKATNVLEPYIKNLKEIETKQSQIRVLNQLELSEQIEEEIKLIESEIEKLNKSNLIYQIALECIKEHYKFLIEEKCLKEDNTWNDVEARYNQRFVGDEDDYIGEQTLRKFLNTAIEKLENILKPALRFAS